MTFGSRWVGRARAMPGKASQSESVQLRSRLTSGSYTASSACQTKPDLTVRNRQVRVIGELLRVAATPTRRAGGRRGWPGTGRRAAHDGRVQQPAQQQRRRDRERERDLAERLQVHRRGLIAVEGDPGHAGRRSRRRPGSGARASASTETTTGMAAEAQRAQRRDLAGARGDRRVHRVDRAEDRAEAHQHGDADADRPDDRSAAPATAPRSSPARGRTVTFRRGSVVSASLSVWNAVGDSEPQHRPTGSCCRAGRPAAARGHRTRSPIRRRCRRPRRSRPPCHAFLPHRTVDPTVRPLNCRDAARPTTISLRAGLEHPPFDDLELRAHLQRLGVDAAQRHVGVGAAALQRDGRR